MTPSDKTEGAGETEGTAQAEQAGKARQGAAREERRSLSLRDIRASWLSAVMLFAPLSLLAEMLIRKTHHRPLGAATFATFAVLLWAGAEILSRRFLNAEVCAHRARRRRWMWVLSIFAAMAVIFRALVVAPVVG